MTSTFQDVNSVIRLSEGEMEQHTPNEMLSAIYQASTLINSLHGIAYRCKCDAELTIEFMSEGCIQLMGYHPSEFIGKSRQAYHKHILYEDQNWLNERLQTALKQRQSYEIEYRLITQNGQQKWVWEKGEGIYSHSGELLFIEGFITDISDRHSTELAVKESQRQLVVCQAKDCEFEGK